MSERSYEIIVNNNIGSIFSYIGKNSVLSNEDDQLKLSKVYHIADSSVLITEFDGGKRFARFIADSDEKIMDSKVKLEDKLKSSYLKLNLKEIA